MCKKIKLENKNRKARMLKSIKDHFEVVFFHLVLLSKLVNSVSTFYLL